LLTFIMRKWDRRYLRSACPLYAGLLLAWMLAGTAAAQTTGAARDSTPAADERVAALRRLLSDYGGLTRYGSENSELPPPRAGERRVVFFGDDATERWKDPAVFSAGRAINRGIAGQNSAQLLLRFRQDVIGLSPAVVVIHAGSNDLARMLGPGTRGTFADNIMSMTELAKAHGIRVVLASILPVCDCFSEQTALRSPVRLADFNEWLREYATSAGAVYLDYFSALSDGRPSTAVRAGSFRRELTADGLLPNAAGYAVMAPLAEAAIAEAMKK
jgi:acyl-CoA thioesterase I